MQLKLTTDYAINIILYLSTVSMASSSELSARLGISQNYIKKLMKSSNLVKFVETYPGRSGGLKLRTLAKNITLYDVIYEMEKTIFNDSCAENEVKCDLCRAFQKDSCPIRASFKKIQQSIKEECKDITFYELSREK